MIAEKRNPNLIVTVGLLGLVEPLERMGRACRELARQFSQKNAFLVFPLCHRAHVSAPVPVVLHEKSVPSGRQNRIELNEAMAIRGKLEKSCI